MQRIYITVLVVIVAITAACKKNNNTTTDPNNIPGLPPATQTGANTLGFLLNGVPWTPAGNNGTANLSIDFDPGIDNGVMGITAYRITNSQQIQYFGFGIIDSLNVRVPPYTIALSKTSLYRCRFYMNLDCYLLSIENETQSTGSITILKLDRTNRIVAGSFNAMLHKIGCDSIKITNGRFDLKF